jgi:hypothetical protein
MTRVQGGVMLFLICSITVVRIMATHSIFSPTYDEPLHVAAGHQYLTEHRYTVDMSHPPLARVLFAFPLRRAIIADSVEGYERVGQIFASAGDYSRGVATARRGNLIFVVLAILGVALWTWQLTDTTTAVTAAGVFALLPPVLAHGGLATTDMAGTAAFAVGMATFHWWLQSPTALRSTALAIAVGLGLLTKFSFPLFFGIGALCGMAARRRYPWLRGIIVLFGAMVVVWGGYFWRQLPRFFKGLKELRAHDLRGHEAYFLGSLRTGGWWFYFPVVLAIKTPLPVLALAGAGSWLVFRLRRHRQIVVMAVLMLLAAMTSRLNLGVRHLLPVYVPMAVLAAIAIIALWQSAARWVVALMCIWLIMNSLSAHPDYLPWTNALGGRHPERLALDSNFDWGQDARRLSVECRRRGITELGVMLFGTADLRRLGLPTTHAIDEFRSAPGWYAVSESAIIPAQVRNPQSYSWLTGNRPFDRVGRTIRLYRVQ